MSHSQNTPNNWVKVTGLTPEISPDELCDYVRNWSEPIDFQFQERPHLENNNLALFQTTSRTKRRKLISAKPHMLNGIKLRFKTFYPNNVKNAPIVPEIERKIYFNNFLKKMTQVDLETVFIRFGKIENLVLIVSAQENTTENHGYLVYSERISAIRALKQKMLVVNKFHQTINVTSDFNFLERTENQNYPEHRAGVIFPLIKKESQILLQQLLGGDPDQLQGFANKLQEASCQEERNEPDLDPLHPNNSGLIKRQKIPFNKPSDLSEGNELKPYKNLDILQKVADNQRGINLKFNPKKLFQYHCYYY